MDRDNQSSRKRRKINMSYQAIASSSLILRILTLLALVSSIVVFVVNKVSVIVDLKNLLSDTGVKLTFSYVITYRYVLSVAVIGAAYILFQLPYVVYQVSTGKRMIPGGCLPEFDFYADKIVSYTLATGVGAGLAVSFELKSFVSDLFRAIADANADNPDDINKARDGYNKFLDRGIIATALLSLGFIFMAAVSVLSSIARGKKTFFG